MVLPAVVVARGKSASSGHAEACSPGGPRRASLRPGPRSGVGRSKRSHHGSRRPGPMGRRPPTGWGRPPCLHRLGRGELEGLGPGGLRGEGERLCAHLACELRVQVPGEARAQRRRRRAVRRLRLQRPGADHGHGVRSGGGVEREAEGEAAGEIGGDHACTCASSPARPLPSSATLCTTWALAASTSAASAVARPCWRSEARGSYACCRGGVPISGLLRWGRGGEGRAGRSKKCRRRALELLPFC